MPALQRLNPFPPLLRRISNFAISLLTKPVARYSLTIPNDLAQLKRNLRKCDVVLVEGNERVSECIKYLTQSSWSHSSIYVGDEPLKHNPEWKRELTEKYGDDANHLMLEALVEDGVVLTPLSKYRNFNIRICRPYKLSAADQRAVINFALSHVGDRYDFRNIFDLARYFLPVSLVPARLRRQALHFGSSDPTRVICSSLLAECFHQVRYPVVPRFEPFPPGFEPVRRVQGLLGRFSRNQDHGPGLLRMVSPTLITPRDFDLSPYFEIVKFTILEGSRFDYHSLLWIEEPEKSGDADPTLEKSA
ncbi:MAG TPA: YiiX/YebB-like N1pC/P60 family cysteine hydrolase [Candidatus Binataceae bacterium]|nr:YiiX/YebB-like N1pC/P60 family cysteine hydrolase [Candidatus Binataceae bacterium]